ncbi:MAG: CaiB/BaiF CoA transferase family protein [Candidatus Limnocylindria bacterium]
MGRVLGDGRPPLAGIRVLEVGNYMAGPFCGMQLADLGADVIKVESPRGGDMSRATAPFVGGESANFVRINRNKRSLALDLKRDAGRAIFRRLARGADAIVENLRPGTMADLGLAPDGLLADNERLVYVAITGWGQDGPYADRPALDIIVQGMSGLMSITGEPDRPPVKVGVPIADLVSALYAALAAVSALAARERDGRGQLVDLSLYESAVSLAIWEAGQYLTTGEVPRPLGSAHRTSAPYQAIRAADGHFTVGGTSPRNWSGFCLAFGLPELERDERFADVAARRRNASELIALVEELSAARPMAHWLARLRDLGVPCGEIRDYGQVFSDPHLAARGAFPELPHPTLGTVRSLGSPLRFARTRVRMERAGPLLGEHSAEVLAELGCSGEEIRRLIDEGTVASP